MRYIIKLNTKMKPKLDNIVKNAFNSLPSIIRQKKLLNMGLWKSEEILIKHFFKKQGVTLDVGCGTGRTTIPLSKLGFDTIGIDISEKLIEIAKSNPYKENIHYGTGDCTNLSYNDNSFNNALFSFNGWCQIPYDNNRTEALNEIYRVLKPNGIFIFTSHIRNIFDNPLFWLNHKLDISINNLFAPCNKYEFGDLIFSKTDENVTYTQYTNITNSKQTIKKLKSVGFNILQATRRSDIYNEEDTIYKGNDCMFYVVQK